MIRFTKYFWAHIVAIMGVWICLLDTQYPLLFAFSGGWFIGQGIRIAKEYGEEKNNLKN